MNQRLSDIWKFITYDIWRITESEVTRTKFSIYNIIKTIYLCVNRFNKDRIVNKASALTYSTLLAIVPILAIVFAIARGFGVSTLMESQFRDGFGGSTEATDIILQFVDSYLSQTKNGIFIGVGLVMLLWTVLNLVSNIEITFNRIWQVKKGRSMYRKITDYFSMFLLMPILIVVSGGLSIFVGTMLKSMADFVLLAPILKFLIRKHCFKESCRIKQFPGHANHLPDIFRIFINRKLPSFQKPVCFSVFFHCYGNQIICYKTFQWLSFVIFQFPHLDLFIVIDGDGGIPKLFQGISKPLLSFLYPAFCTVKPYFLVSGHYPE